MPTVAFTRHLERYLQASPAAVEAATVGDALAAVFATRPQLRGYVLDDQGGLRRHVACYVNGQPVRDRARLSDRVASSDRIFVIQALTGG